MSEFKRKEFKKEEPKVYVAKKDRKKKVEDNLGEGSLKVARPVETELKPLKDERLDEVVPLFVDMIGKLLSSGGMMRYRSDLIKKVKEIMNEKKK